MRSVIFSLLVLMALFVSITGAYAQTNKVLSLDGDGDYVEIVDSPTLNNIPSQVTIETWIQIDSFTGDWSPIVYKGDEPEPGNSNRSYTLWIHSTGLMHLTSSPSGEATIVLNSSASSIRLDIWYHVAGVVDTVNGYMRIYINGIEAANGEYGDDIRISTLPLLIGYSQEGYQDLSAYLDEIRIWNVARTQEQIQSTMNTSLTGSEEGLVGYWNFDDGTANDLTANNNDGTLYGDAKIVNQLYVSSSGDNGNDGSKEHPFRTIQYAIFQSRRNDIITALPGTYEENIILYSDLVLQGSGADETTITAASGNVISANNVYNVMLYGFTIDGQGTADNGILCAGTTSYMEIKNNTVTNAGDGIECADNATVEIRNNRILMNSTHGIYCSGESDVTIDSNEVYAHVYEGIAFVGEALATATNNEVNDNQRHGISCWDDTNVKIESNNIYKNQSNGINCADSSQVEVAFNTISHNKHGIWFTQDQSGAIVGNLIQSNNHRGIVLSQSTSPNIIRNTIRDHNGAIDIHDTSNPIIGGSLTNANYFDKYRSHVVRNYTDNTIDASYNYCGIDDESEISDKMINEGEGSIIFKPFIGDPELIGDVSGSGGITAYDASLILQYCVGLIDQLPANISSIASNITPRNRTISIPNVSVKTNVSDISEK